jgi:hypothetical protein
LFDILLFAFSVLRAHSFRRFINGEPSMTDPDDPKTWRITRGTIEDYRALACFHYLAGPPAAHKRIYVIRPPRNWPGATPSCCPKVCPKGLPKPRCHGSANSPRAVRHGSANSSRAGCHGSANSSRAGCRGSANSPRAVRHGSANSSRAGCHGSANSSFEFAQPCSHKRSRPRKSVRSTANLCTPRLAAVLVVSPPVSAVAGRNYATGGRYAVPPLRNALALLNREIECISRVIVHPIFRSCGLAVRLVRHALAAAQTPMMESLAAMGAIHPLFTRGGLRCFGRYKGNRSYIYYLGNSNRVRGRARKGRPGKPNRRTSNKECRTSKYQP